MIILDTGVLSALMQQLPDPVVVNWLDAQAVKWRVKWTPPIPLSTEDALTGGGL